MLMCSCLCNAELDEHCLSYALACWGVCNESDALLEPVFINGGDLLAQGKAAQGKPRNIDPNVGRQIGLAVPTGKGHNSDCRTIGVCSIVGDNDYRTMTALDVTIF